MKVENRWRSFDLVTIGDVLRDIGYEGNTQRS